MLYKLSNSPPVLLTRKFGVKIMYNDWSFTSYEISNAEVKRYYNNNTKSTHKVECKTWIPTKSEDRSRCHGGVKILYWPTTPVGWKLCLLDYIWSKPAWKRTKPLFFFPPLTKGMKQIIPLEIMHKGIRFTRKILNYVSNVLNVITI